jgi:5-formyltetrahydrofolate cyclo-ligase
LILVPGVAFDLRGGRLGRGRGYYDRLLSGLQGYRCGVAFDEQIVDRVPLEPHDASLNCILTPSRWVELEATRAALE